MNREMVIAAQRGHEDSVAKLFKSVQNDAYRVAYSYLKNEHDSMDAVCTGIEKAIGSIRRLKQPEYFKTWFIRIVINESKAILKKKRRETTELSEPVNLETVDHSDKMNTKLDISRAMDALSEEVRQLITLKYYLEMTFSEIADVTGLPESTVKSKLYKALKSLKRHLE